MDLLGYTIEYLNNKAAASTSLLKSRYGLCDFVKDENKYYHYVGNGQGKPVTDYDNTSGTLLWTKRGQVTFTEAPSNLRDVSCNDYYTINYPLRGIAVLRKKDFPCDNATTVDQLAQNLLTSLGGKDKVLRKAIGASLVDIVPRGYVELKNITYNLQYAALGIDYDIQISIKKNCIPKLCEDVPL